MPQPLPTMSDHDHAAPAERPDWGVDPFTGGLSGGDATGRRAFLRMVSHELRTPLNSIIGFAEILQSELYGPLGAPAYVEYAGIIRDSGQKLLGLFNSFIEIVRLEGGSHGYEAVLEPVLPALEEAVARWRVMARARGIAIDIRTCDERMCALYDPRALAACLDQLLGNALDFTPAGEAIEVDARPMGSLVEISVFNRGDAPDPADIARLMRPFEQGNGAQGTDGLTRTREGAGLGWAIVRLNAEALGGTFNVVSRRGESLTAILRLKRM
ncbi:MAG: sensor histidine kinase [Asticcacaulis sp.]